MDDTRLVFYFSRTMQNEVHGRESSSVRTARIYHDVPKLSIGPASDCFLVANGRLYPADDAGFAQAQADAACSPVEEKQG